MAAARHDGRSPDQLRPLTITRGFTRAPAGSVLIQAGGTRVLCTASVSHQVPAWMAGQGRGWITAEYAMLPGSTRPRKARDGAKPDGRGVEIQRLIGRSLRTIIDLDLLGENAITIDCDVLEADGGTRTASITGAMVALVNALATIPNLKAPIREILRDSVAAVSVGIVDGRPALDLDYVEDAAASVDMNVVMTGRGQFVEIGGAGEEATFDDVELAALLSLARGGIAALRARQEASLGPHWPWRS